MNARTQGYIYLTAAMALVGTTVVASKVTAAAIPPFTATALRFALAFPCFLLLMRWTGTRWPRVGWRDAVLLLVQSLAGSVGYTALLMLGLRTTSATDAGVIIGSLPIVAALCAALLLRERPDRVLLAAIAMAGGGLFALAPHGGAGTGSSWTGNALVLAAVVCESLFILLNRRLRADIEPLALSAIMTGLGLAASFAMMWTETSGSWHLLSSAGMAVLYYALLPTVAGFVLWYAGARRVSASEAAVFTAVAPVTAVLVAMAVLRERPGIGQLAGIACVLGAIAVLALRGRRGAAA